MTIHVSERKYNGVAALKVDGQLKAADVSELKKAYQLAPSTNVLDLSDLQSADNAGVTMLRELVSFGLQIRNASPYIELLMKSKTSLPHSQYYNEGPDQR